MGHVRRRLIAFDLDGTLIDSRRDLADSANALIVERGGRPLPEDDIGRMVGEGAAMLVRRALLAAGVPLDDRSLPRFLELYDERLLRTTKPYPGIPEALEQLQPQGVLAVLTNKPLAPTRKLLSALGLAPRFSDTVGGDGPFPRKPDPASLRYLMARFAVDPSLTVLVGDSRIDFETACAAGVRICLARYGFGYEGAIGNTAPSGGDGVTSPAELPQKIAELLS